MIRAGRGRGAIGIRAGRARVRGAVVIHDGRGPGRGAIGIRAGRDRSAVGAHLDPGAVGASFDLVAFWLRGSLGFLRLNGKRLPYICQYRGDAPNVTHSEID